MANLWEFHWREHKFNFSTVYRHVGKNSGQWLTYQSIYWVHIT
jgi:hypothetical protein